MIQSEVSEERYTTWRNPTAQEMRVDIYDRPGRRKRFVIGPGQEVRIPSEYDRAIHDVRNGVIVGGLAPLLERVAGNGILHPALDPDEVARKAAQEEAERAVTLKKAADDVLAAQAAKAARTEKSPR